MVEEMESLKKNEAWDLVQLPQENRAIGYKWVYKKKLPVIKKRRGNIQGSPCCKRVFTTEGY